MVSSSWSPRARQAKLGNQADALSWMRARPARAERMPPAKMCLPQQARVQTAERASARSQAPRSMTRTIPALTSTRACSIHALAATSVASICRHQTATATTVTAEIAFASLASLLAREVNAKQSMLASTTLANPAMQNVQICQPRSTIPRTAGTASAPTPSKAMEPRARAQQGTLHTKGRAKTLMPAKQVRALPMLPALIFSLRK